MTGNRFTNGRTTAITPSNKVFQPYDPTLRFNRVIDQKENDPASIIHSIDAREILEVLSIKDPDVDGLEFLHKLTFAAKPTYDGVGIWDTLFNNASRQAMTACVFSLQNNYTPIPHNRVIYTSTFLNFNMAVSRVHFNQIIVGDRLGVAIHDIPAGLVYILFYLVEEICTVASKYVGSEGRPILFPGINIRLEHALRIDHEGGVNIAEMEGSDPYNHDITKPFVEWVVESVYDISKAYPWKPHFLPIPVGNVDRTVLEERLQTQIDAAQPISYSEFETLCRRYYMQAKFQKDPPSTTRKRPSARRRGEQQVTEPTSTAARIPVIEVVSLENKFVVRFDKDSDQTNASYTFNSGDLGKNLITETFLTNKDLEGIDVVESSRALVLSADTFGENAYMRFLSVNF